MKIYSASQTVLQSTFASLAASQLQKRTAASSATSAASTDAMATTTSGSSASSLLASAIANAMQYQAKQQEAMKTAIAALRAMPSSSKEASKRMATEKAAMLKQVLDMLKQMAIGATPAQAKALAAQLKDIAKQLASLGKLLSDNSGAAEPISTSATAPGTVASTAAAIATASTIATSTDTASATVTATAGTDATTSSPRNTSQALAAYAAEFSRVTLTGNQSGNATDKELKAALQDALKSLRAVLALLKSKLGSHNKDIKDAENKMQELTRSLSESGNPNKQIAATSIQDSTAATDADTVNTTIPAIDTSTPTDISISVST